MRTVLCLALLLMACKSTPTTRTDALEAEVDAGSEVKLDTMRRGMSCPDRLCGEGLECRQYYGIAGPNSAPFTQCVVPCGVKDRCPEGEKCVTVNDGPGRICLPAGKNQPAAGPDIR